MAYKQLRNANPGVAGKSGYCLTYARTVFGVSSKYPTAAIGWASARFRHTGALPTVAVPVWFRWRSDGHVAVYVPGKGVYSTTAQGVKLFPSVQACADYVHATYLGWSEDINGVRIVEPVANPSPVPRSWLPPVSSRINLIPTQTRTTWKPGTANVAGHIRVTDNTFDYVIRGYDSRYPGRAIINSASGGGDGVGLALYYNNGSIVAGWKAA